MIDVATLKPLDAATILASVKKTGRCVIAHEAPLTGGLRRRDRGPRRRARVLSLLAPIERVAGYDTVMPLPRLEQHYLPDAARHRRRRAPRHGLRMSTFKLPDLGEGLQEAEIVAWHVAEGDHVVADQPLVSVETEKAVVEVPSPAIGQDRAALRQARRSRQGRCAAGRLRGRRSCRYRHGRRASSRA